MRKTQAMLLIRLAGGDSSKTFWSLLFCHALQRDHIVFLFLAEYLPVRYICIKVLPDPCSRIHLGKILGLTKEDSWVFNINISASYTTPEEVFAHQFSLLILLSELANCFSLSFVITLYKHFILH